MALIRTLTISNTAFERTKEKFYGFRQTVFGGRMNVRENFEEIVLACVRWEVWVNEVVQK